MVSAFISVFNELVTGRTYLRREVRGEEGIDEVDH